MESYIQIVKALSDTEQTIHTSTLGLLMKTILLNNTTATPAEATLNLDGVAFKFQIKAHDQYILTTPILVKTLKATSETGVNLHITGLVLG